MLLIYSFLDNNLLRCKKRKTPQWTKSTLP